MNNLISTRRNDYQLKYDETELRLGLPGGEPESGKSYGKRGFTETDVDLKLNLHMVPSKDVNGGQEQKSVMKEKTLLPCVNDPAKPSAHKAQLVGWPPVRSYRKNILAVQSSKNANEEINPSAAFVKVSMDGAPYLRKVDLKLYKSYQELSNSLEKMFSSFTIGMNEGKELMTDSKNKLMALVNESEYVPTYEDKDGDWMLVGDVPWEMFVDSCKRLRIMKRSEAIGLEPRVMEKCKNKS